jgi:hypothetical protein
MMYLCAAPHVVMSFFAAGRNGKLRWHSICLRWMEIFVERLSSQGREIVTLKYGCKSVGGGAGLRLSERCNGSHKERMRFSFAE